MSELSRRGFIGTLIGGIAAQAAVRTWPFRVFSFPTEIKRDYYSIEWPVMSRKWEYGVCLIDRDLRAKVDFTFQNSISRTEGGSPMPYASEYPIKGRFAWTPRITE